MSKNSLKYYIIFGVLGLVLWACRKDAPLSIFPDPVQNIGWLESIEHPEDNMPNQVRFELGKKLFYDKNLSADHTISCASCHQPALAFADDEPISPGVEGKIGFRNAPTLVNVAYQKRFFMDGGIPNLELQALAPIEDHNEMALNINEAAQRIENNPEYIRLSQEAYNRQPDPYVIVRALSVFQRQIISSETPWEQTVYNEKNQMSDAALKGWQVFKVSGCRSCHSGPNLTDYQYHNIGLYETYEDNGRERISMQPEDNGKFKTPTLRNIMLTAPYMHDGSLATIDDVLDHFETGGNNHTNQSSLIKEQSWSQEDRDHLKAFFHSLTDTSFIEQYNLRK